MRVSLVSKTTHAETPSMTLGEILAHVARVSNPSNQMNKETSAKLLTYCLKNKHWSVFESASITMRIETSRAIAQQILRHRSFTFQEFSQRYAEAVEREYYEARSQDPKNRQSSRDDMSGEEKDWFMDAQHRVWTFCYSFYKEALSKGIAKEQARFLLPLSTRTTIYMTGCIRSWIHYCELRGGKSGTQKEHNDIAVMCRDILIEQIPELKEYLLPEGVDGGKQ